MARTCDVRFPASWFTLSVRSLHVPAAPGTLAWPPSFPSIPTSRATVVTWSANVRSVSVIALIVSASAATSPLASRTNFCFKSPLATAVTTLHDAAHLLRQVRGHEVDVVGQVLPRAGDARHVGLTAELSFDTDLARDRRHLVGESAERVRHVVDRFGERRHLAFALRGRTSALRSPLATAVTTLTMPRTCLVRFEAMKFTLSVRSFHVPDTPFTSACPPSFPSVPTSFATRVTSAANEFSWSTILLMTSLICEDLAFDVDRDLLRQVAVGDGGRDLRHVTKLHGEVGGEAVDVVGQVLPRARDALHVGLPAELSFRTDLFRDARHLRRERVQLCPPSC